MALREAFVAGYAGLRQHLTRRFGCADAAEAVQDAWLRIGEAAAIPTLRDPEAYLVRLAGNIAVDGRRAEHRRRLLARGIAAILDAAEERPGPEEAALARDEVRRLADALAELPPRVRVAFLAARLDGTPHREIARSLGVSLRTVDGDIRRALEHCAERLGREPPPPCTTGDRRTSER